MQAGQTNAIFEIQQTNLPLYSVKNMNNQRRSNALCRVPALRAFREIRTTLSMCRASRMANAQRPMASAFDFAFDNPNRMK